MRCLRPLLRELSIAYHRWALAEIPLTHPDLPAVVLRLRELLDERRREGPGPIEAAWRWL
jgi:hypothetical protein